MTQIEVLHYLLISDKSVSDKRNSNEYIVEHLNCLPSYYGLEKLQIVEGVTTDRKFFDPKYSYLLNRLNKLPENEPVDQAEKEQRQIFDQNYAAIILERKIFNLNELDNFSTQIPSVDTFRYVVSNPEEDLQIQTEIRLLK
nr:hypothetical protein pmam_508 [Pithovirus mammoth]